MSSNPHPAIQLFTALLTSGLMVESDGAHLYISPAGMLTPETAELVRTFKPDLVTLIDHPPADPAERPSVRMCPVCFRLIGWGLPHGECTDRPAPGTARYRLVMHPQPITVRLIDIEEAA